jgi:hypothetical protein
MGIEFIRKAAKTFKRRWDTGRRELGTSDLFTCEPTYLPRTLPFDLGTCADLHIGEMVTVEAEGNALIARLRLTAIARAENPPTEVLRAVQESCGIAKGTVQQIYDLSRVAEISLC